MSVIDDRPLMIEQIGVAANANSLAMDEDSIRAADKLAALGQACLRRNADGVPVHSETGTAVHDPMREVIALIWRAKAGQDAAAVSKAAVILSQIIFAKGKARPLWLIEDVQVRLAFSARCVQERVEDSCPACKGSGAKGGIRAHVKTTLFKCAQCQGLGQVRGFSHRHGTPVTRPCEHCCGKRYVQRKIPVQAERERACPACAGSGVRARDDVSVEQARIAALGIDRPSYRSLWVRRFAEMSALLNRSEDGLSGGLHTQLRERSIRNR